MFFKLLYCILKEIGDDKMDFNIEKNSDKEYVLGQVRQQGKILDLASEDFKKDKEVVLEAVKMIQRL